MVGSLLTHHFCGQFVKVNKSLKVSSNKSFSLLSKSEHFALRDGCNVNTGIKKY